jgi:peptidylprolyl isomerase
VTDNKPEIEFPEGPPPGDLEVLDIVEGDGDEARPGSVVDVHYVGVAYSTGEEFDASYNRGEPLQFPLGTGTVIPGWDQGVNGMRVGGRRRLVVPPHLAYGDAGAGGVIAPGETLIFVVDLVGVGCPVSRRAPPRRARPRRHRAPAGALGGSRSPR